MRRVRAVVSEEDYRDQAAALEEEVELDMVAVAVAAITDWAASIMAWVASLAAVDQADPLAVAAHPHRVPQLEPLPRRVLRFPSCRSSMRTMAMATIASATRRATASRHRRRAH